LSLPVIVVLAQAASPLERSIRFGLQGIRENSHFSRKSLPQLVEGKAREVRNQDVAAVPQNTARQENGQRSYEPLAVKLETPSHYNLL
jgi:hypothetical protein